MFFQPFGRRIRKLRNLHGLTLTQLAAKLELDSANLSKIETGKREFDEKRLPLLCSVFNLDIDEMKKELLSDQFASKVYNERIDTSVFSLAAEKVKYITQKNHKQAEMDL